MIGKNIHERHSAREGGFGSSTGEKEYMLPIVRNVGIREGTKTLLQAIRTVENVIVFDESVVSSIQPPRGEEKMLSASIMSEYQHLTRFFCETWFAKSTGSYDFLIRQPNII